MSARIVMVNEVLGGHVALDIECLDRVYLNAYVPILQSSGQVVAFMTQYLDLPIPSPALLEKISQRFRRSVASFAEANDIPWVKFAKDDRRADVMAPYLKQAAALHWAISGAAIRSGTRTGLHAWCQGHCRASSVQVGAQASVVIPRPRQVLR